LLTTGPKLGQQRVGGELWVTADPNRSSTVYLAWADLLQSNYTLHLRKSIDRGNTWSDDLLSVVSGINPAIAVAEDSNVGFLYQQLVKENWETHFRRSMNGDRSWPDTLLARVPPKTPRAAFQPHIGLHVYMTSAGGHFYGVFSASNDPKPDHFPQGVQF